MLCHLSQAWDTCAVGFAGPSILAVLLLLDSWRPGGGLEAAQVHDPPGRDHVLGTHISQGALLKPAEHAAHVTD